MDLRTLFIIGHILGVALGVGGATLSDTLFLSYLKGGKLTKEQVSTLELVSKFVQTGLAILILSGFGFLYLWKANLAALPSTSPKIFVKLLVSLIILVNGILMHKLVFPLIREAIGKSIGETKLAHRQTLAFTLGAVSASSWYFNFILGALGRIETSYPILLAIYLVVVTGAVLGANIVGRLVLREGEKNA